MRRALLLLLSLAAAAEEPPKKQPDFGWVLTFQNGDLVHCRLIGLTKTKLTVAWEIAPDSPVSLDLSKVNDVRRESVEADAPTSGDALRLKDGSLLRGRVVRFFPDEVEFDVPRVGRLTVPGRDVQELVRDAPDRELPQASESEHVVLTKAGNLLTGKLEQGDAGKLVLRSETVSASIDYESVAIVLFPATSGQEEEDPDGKAPPGVQVKTRYGSALAGKEPSLEEGVLAFRMGSGEPVRIPVAELEQITFLSFGELVGRAGMRSLLVWSAFADPNDELRKTLDIVRNELKRWRIEEIKKPGFDEDFRRALFRARTLLVPEMEKWSADPAALAREFRPMAKAFLRAGGNIVVCGAQNKHLEFLKEAGLVDLRVQGTVDNQNIAFTAEGAKLGAGAGGWRAVNATWSYGIGPSIRAVPLASAGTRHVAVGRRVGRGWMVVLGMDFYLTNPSASRVLTNAIQLR